MMKAFEPMDFTLLLPEGEKVVTETRIVQVNKLPYLLIISAMGVFIVALIVHYEKQLKKKERIN